jgi:hypothetical protein
MSRSRGGADIAGFSFVIDFVYVRVVSLIVLNAPWL